MTVVTGREGNAMNTPLDELSGSGATDRLRGVIEKHQEESRRQTDVMVKLTWWMMLLTIATVSLAVVQVVLAIVPFVKPV